MPYYAITVVVEAPDETSAYDFATQGAMQAEGKTLFVGEPWKVQPINEYPDHEIEGGPPGPVFEPEFGSLECFDQHPER